MPSSQQDERNFKIEVVMDNLPNDLLQQAIDWISNAMYPEEVFPIDKLTDWADDNIDKLDENKLEKWAESNGYTKE